MFKPKATVVTLYDKIAKETNPHVISFLVADTYNFDVPWAWHLERVLRQVESKYYRDAAYMKAIVEWYVKFIQNIETQILSETKVPLDLCSISNGRPSSSLLQDLSSQPAQ